MSRLFRGGSPGSPGKPKKSSTYRLTGLSVPANFWWSATGNIVYGACRWGELSVLAKLGTPEMVGAFVLAYAITGPVIMFASLQLRDLLATDADAQHSFGQYLRLRVATASVALLLIAGIALATGYDRSTKLLILAAGLVRGLESVRDIYHGLLQQHERMDRIALSQLISSPLSLVALGASVHFSGQALWGVAAMAAVQAAVLLGYDIRSARLVLSAAPGSSEPAQWRGFTEALAGAPATANQLTRLAWLALPLGLTRLLMSLNPSVPRYAIEFFLERRELGIFAAMAYLKTPGDLLVNALVRSTTPRLARYYSHGQSRDYRSLLLRMLGVGLVVGLVSVLAVLLAGRPLLAILYKPEYADYPDVLAWLMIAAAFGYLGSVLTYGLTAARKFNIQLPIQAATVLSTALLCLWLVPTQGLMGAAIALLVSSAVRAVGTSIVFARDARAMSISSGDLRS